jgi:Enoyl-CoA hydratase/carnithine racemase
VRAVVLAAEGPAFCAGANLNWMRRMADYTRDENVADAAKLAEMLRVIYECPKPTIARVQGDVYAGGMGLVAACDMAVAVDTAGFCLSEVKLGLIPATISPYVIRAMGARAAHRYFLTAERFGAFDALRIGFVHEVVAPTNSTPRWTNCSRPSPAPAPTPCAPARSSSWMWPSVRSTPG